MGQHPENNSAMKLLQEREQLMEAEGNCELRVQHNKKIQHNLTHLRRLSGLTGDPVRDDRIPHEMKLVVVILDWTSSC